ncbi:Methylosome protein 50 [Phytophthora palmivora]|uniref:Methylosome protein 50 n=1 Tax=Phytophthora palmivora TaxID=4796 RepID=A0A2P4XEM9_9STRA|nr:Methylosome protein 50 [Phytophthora palmivora]
MWRSSQPQLERIVWNGGVGLVDATACEGLCELEAFDRSLGAAQIKMCCWRWAAVCVQLSMDSGNNEEDATNWGRDDVVTGVSASTDVAGVGIDGGLSRILLPHGFDLERGDAMLSISGYDSAGLRSLVVSTLVPALSVDWHHKQPTVLSVELEDQMIRTYDVRSPHTPLARRETDRAAVHAGKYSPYHGDLLATGGDDGKAYVTADSFSSDRTASSGIDELLVGEENTAPHRDYV